MIFGRELKWALTEEAALAQLRDDLQHGADEFWAERAPEVIARTVRELLKNDTPEAIAELADFEPSMVREGLTNLADVWTEDALAELQDSVFSRRGKRSVIFPNRIFHITAGNLFVSGLESLVLGMLTGAVNLVRFPIADPIFLYWKQVLDRICPEISADIIVGHWPREYTSIMELAIKKSDVVVAFGNDATTQELSTLVSPPRRFIGHGSKWSFAVVDLNASSPDTATRLAYDFTVYDQQGCLSPQAAFLIGTQEQAREFAHQLTLSMFGMAQRLPRRKLSLEETAALTRIRDEVLTAAASGKVAYVLSGPSDPYLVTLRMVMDFDQGATNRHCNLFYAADAGTAIRPLNIFRGHVASLGVEVQDVNTIVETCDALRIPRICRIGKMQKPPLGWAHDGREPLRDLVEYKDIEL